MINWLVLAFLTSEMECMEIAISPNHRCQKAYFCYCSLFTYYCAYSFIVSEHCSRGCSFV